MARISYPRASALRAAVLARRAAGMRAVPTPGERVLWAALRGGRLGVRFTRQVVLGDCIADFCCRSARLVVEIDGGYHAWRVAKDAERDTKLARRGFRTLRLSEQLVLTQLEEALRRIFAALARDAE
jgi:very-short-patch-repair endonuclease